MRSIFANGRYANITATVALVVAISGGTAYAANTIRSSDIVNGQVKRVDIKKNAINSGKVANGSLKARDFRAGQLPAGPAGPAGATGATGATGAPGATGPRGPSNAFASYNPGVINWSTTFASQRTLNLPAGSFVLTGSGLGNNNGAATADVDCQLLLGGTAVADLNTLTPGAQGAAGERMTIAMTGAGTLAAPGTAELQCRSSEAGNILGASLVAVQVATLTTT